MEKQRRKYLLEKGDKSKHSHLIIVIDRSNFVPEEIIKYVDRKEDIKNIIFNFACNPNLDIWNIFNYDMDLDKQINEHRPYHMIAPYNKMNDAYTFAQERHKGQVRKDGTSYFCHPVKVSELIDNYFANHPKVNELITASYLHDLVEDTNTTIEEIKDRFGEYVAYLVEGVTNDKKQIEMIGKTNYLCNKMLNMEEDVLNLKLCDRLANILDLDCVEQSFSEKYEIETILILNYLLNNKELTKVQMDIIKNINEEINNKRKQKIIRMTKV